MEIKGLDISYKISTKNKSDAHVYLPFMREEIESILLKYEMQIKDGEWAVKVAPGKKK